MLNFHLKINYIIVTLNVGTYLYSDKLFLFSLVYLFYMPKNIM